MPGAVEKTFRILFGNDKWRPAHLACNNIPNIYYFSVLNKGQVLTDYYRLMNKHGGYIWIQSCATVICNAKNAEDQNIITINYVLRYTIDFCIFWEEFA